MQLNEIEMIHLSIKMEEDTVIFMKVYKEGTLIRNGAGGLPGVETSAMATLGDPLIFQQLIQEIPEQVLEKDLNFEDPKAKKLLEYVTVFYGKSKNGEHGERADWGAARGLRFAFDPENPVQHPLVSFLDGIVSRAAYLLEPWYFDVMIQAGLEMKSTSLVETMIAMPSGEGAVERDFSQYITQVVQSGTGWTLNKLAEGKSYERSDGLKFSLKFEDTDGNLKYHFNRIF